MNRHRRSGMLLIEIMPTVAITGIALSMAAVLMGRAWKVDRTLAADEARDRSIAQFVSILRNDARSATSFKISNVDRAMVGEKIVWTTTPHSITRDDGINRREWQTGDFSPTFETRTGGFSMRMIHPKLPARDDLILFPKVWINEVKP